MQYLKKEEMDEVDFYHADKHQIILQVDIIKIGGYGKACPNYSKKNKVAKPLQYLKKKVRDEF